jgi:hypothetical protein
LDGLGYNWRGIPGTFLMDAAISIAACLLLGWIITRMPLTQVPGVRPLSPVVETKE